MDNNDILRIAEQSMKENRELLNNLGFEKNVRLGGNPDEDIILRCYFVTRLNLFQ